MGLELLQIGRLDSWVALNGKGLDGVLMVRRAVETIWCPCKSIPSGYHEILFSTANVYLEW